MPPLNAAIPFPEGDALAYGNFRLCGALKNGNLSNSVAPRPLKPLMLLQLCNGRIMVQKGTIGGNTYRVCLRIPELRYVEGS